MRAVLDANVIVSAVLTPGGPPGRVMRALFDGRFDVVISASILQEVADVLGLPRIARKYQIPTERIEQVVALLRLHGDVVPVSGTLRICRDPKDDVVLETALSGNAEVLVSRDADITRDVELIDALRERNVAVLTVRQFLEALDAEPPERA